MVMLLLVLLLLLLLLRVLLMSMLLSCCLAAISCWLLRVLRIGSCWNSYWIAVAAFVVFVVARFGPDRLCYSHFDVCWSLMLLFYLSESIRPGQLVCCLWLISTSSNEVIFLTTFKTLLRCSSCFNHLSCNSHGSEWWTWWSCAHIIPSISISSFSDDLANHFDTHLCSVDYIHCIHLYWIVV